MDTTMTDYDAEDANRQALTLLSAIVREMTPASQKSIPSNPQRFNLLAHPASNTCRICNLPGHASPNVNNTMRCRTALLSSLSWDSGKTPSTSSPISFKLPKLSKSHQRKQADVRDASQHRCSERRTPGRCSCGAADMCVA